MANLPKLNTLLAVPIIATQLIFILYIAVVANNHIKNYSAYPKFNLAVIATLITLTISCLIQTYRSNPGRVTTDIIEQLKLSLQAFPNQEEEEENEDAVNRIQIKEFNKQLLSLMNSKESSNTSITLDAESQQVDRSTEEEGSQLPEMCKFGYCDKCHIIQPPRAHHCPVCECCILRSDHHCFWMGNCIGLQNQKFFILYLLYATLSCFYTALVFTRFGTINPVQLVDMVFDSPNVIIITFTTLALAICLGILLGITVWMVATNQTTIEITNEATERPYQRGGVVKNAKEVFGESLSLKWVLPTSPDNINDCLQLLIPFQQQ